MTSRDGLFMFCELKPLVQQQDMTEEYRQMRPHIPRMGPEGGRIHPDMESAIRQARGGGQPLNGALKEQMSTALCHDFNKVRVHTGPEADELNRYLGAKAFTFGSDIFFRRGEYDPTSLPGRKLIVHELTHVVQQCTGRVSGSRNRITVCPEGDVFEQEAENLARQVAATPDGHSARDRQHTLIHSELRPTVIQRDLARLINAARNQINPLTAETNLCPKNCHEAVLGWFLTSMNYPRRWRLIRLAAARHPALAGQPAITRQFTGQFMWDNFYTGHTQQVNFNNIHLHTHRGDILVVGIGAAHSMVVVENPEPILPQPAPIPPGTHTHRVYIRGFNNYGALSQLLGSASGFPPYDAGYHQVPVSTGGAAAYDAYDRDVANPRLWRYLPANANNFGFAGGPGAPLYVVSFANAENLVAQLFPWENSSIPITVGQRWHYNPIQGWRWF